MSMRLGTDLRQGPRGGLEVVESPLRLRREASFAYIRVAWLLALDAGPTFLSVPPEAGGSAKALLGGRNPDVDDPSLPARLTEAVAASLKRSGIAAPDRAFRDELHACTGATWRPHALSSVVRLRSEQIPPADGLSLPTQCFPDGVAFGVVQDERVVCCAYAHRTGLMEDRLADLGVETASAYRRRGFAQATVSAVVGHVLSSGGEAHYACAPSNVASLATAASVGFKRYGRSLILGAPAFR